MKKLRAKELSEGLADLAWWQGVADILGLKVVGWTYRHSALLDDGKGHSMQILRWFADAILENESRKAETIRG